MAKFFSVPPPVKVHCVFLGLLLLLVKTGLPATQRLEWDSSAGGDATSWDFTPVIGFLELAPNLRPEHRAPAKVGEQLFGQVWKSGPGGALDPVGLGPLYVAESCQQCHSRGGRGPAPGEGGGESNFLVRLWNSSQEATREGPGPVLQTRSIGKPPPEGALHVEYSEVAVELKGEPTVTLRQPRYRLDLPGFPFHQASPLLPPPLLGLGLLERIPESSLIKLADPEDADQDGISGRCNVLKDSAGGERVGRFGWKAEWGSVRQMVSHDLWEAMGLRSLETPGAGPEAFPEVSGEVLDALTLFVRLLAVPARRDLFDHEVIEGRRRFLEWGCALCHVESWKTGFDVDPGELAGQVIHPYTDLLLHDMGEGMADQREAGQANGREWRTAPLWGIGLTQAIQGRPSYLHDGRARSLTEAVLWHGGEASSSRRRFQEAQPRDRQALLRFLNAL